MDNARASLVSAAWANVRASQDVAATCAARHRGIWCGVAAEVAPNGLMHPPICLPGLRRHRQMREAPHHRRCLCFESEPHLPIGGNVVAIHLDAGHDTNGNPRRVFVLLDEKGIHDVIDEGYRGTPEAAEGKVIMRIPTTPRFRLELLKEWRDTGRVRTG